MGNNKQTIIVLVNFPKKSPFQAKGQFGPNLAQNYSTLYLMFRQFFCFVFFKHFSMMKHNRLTKVTLVSFASNFPFSTIVHFWPSLGQNYATLCPRHICHNDSLYKSFEMQYDGVSQFDQSNISQLTKKFPFGARTIEA